MSQPTAPATTTEPTASGLNPHERALEALELEDIFVVELQCRAPRDLNQAAVHPDIRFQHRFAPQNTLLMQSRGNADSSDKILIIRYYIEGEVRLIKPETPSDRQEFTEDDILATIAGVVAVDYRSTKDLRDDEEAVAAFGSNVLFHAWPYWRNTVMGRAAEMRLPRLVLPMMRQAKKKAIQLEQ